ncbi:MAG TPA: DUF896 domain-containing protein [Virgibacillus sp.]|jgi:uncharacterized protein YnzC (UPF0291/DUF896 family)|nr:DUF896 domain-containing protein [Virgibacillus sp.]
MDFEDRLARINELAKKAKNEGLTEAEKVEQKELRQEYLQSVRQSFTEQFKTMTVMDEEGQDVTPKKVQELQKNNKRKK